MTTQFTTQKGSLERVNRSVNTQKVRVPLGVLGLFLHGVPGLVEKGKKTALLSIESWLFNRDPYNGLL